MSSSAAAAGGERRIPIRMAAHSAATAAIPTLDSEEWAFLALINSYRAQNGAGPLQVSVALENSSRWMSNDMAANNYGSHTDSLGRDPFARMNAFGYTYYPWGENIAGGYSTAQAAFNAWLTNCDPDGSGACTYAHRVNMLNPSFNVIGIARAYNSASTYRWYWTTDFGGVVDEVIPAPGSGSGGVTNPPQISAFSANPASISAGQSSVLTWTVTGADKLTIDNGIGDVTGRAAQTVFPAQTTSYILTASNSAGSTTALATVTVKSTTTQGPSAPVLTATVSAGVAKVDLSWTASVGTSGIASYQILRNGVALTSVSGTTLTYSDTTISYGISYSYSVRAYDSLGNASSPSNAIQAAVNAPTVSCPAPAVGAFTGCYYNNTFLSGNPVLVRTDNQVNFHWGATPPDSSIATNRFSVRWQGSFAFTGGLYTFNLSMSDGMRLYIDGYVSFERWMDQPPYMYMIQRNIPAGTHVITLEYYNANSTATAAMSWQGQSSTAVAPTIAAFYASPSAAITQGQPVTLLWNVTGAGSLSIDNGVGNVTGLSMVTLNPAQSTVYTLTATAPDNGPIATSKVTVTVIPSPQTTLTAPVLLQAVAPLSTEVDLAWSASTGGVVQGYQIARNGAVLANVGAGTLSYADKTVTAGSTYVYTVSAYDNNGRYSPASNSMTVATPALAGACPAPAVNAFTGCYYNNINLTGTPQLVRTDAAINFVWGMGSPAPSLPPGNFSARWKGSFTFAEGTYRFNVVTSDGMRIYIDDQMVLDRWVGQSPYMYGVVRNLTAGSHMITVEYFEQSMAATASVSWLSMN